MSLQALNYFVRFAILEFLVGKRLVFVKASPWKDGDTEVGSKVLVQIVEDKTQYGQPNVSNFGEQLTIKVRGVYPSAYNQLRPLGTEVYLKDVERAVVYGEYRNQLSVIGTIAVKESAASK